MRELLRVMGGCEVCGVHEGQIIEHGSRAWIRYYQHPAEECDFRHEFQGDGTVKIVPLDRAR